MKYPYRSPKSVEKNPTIPIDADDPRLNKLNRGITKARVGAEVEEVNDFTGRLIPQGAYTTSSGRDGSGRTPPVVTPPLDKDDLDDKLSVQLGPISNLTASWTGKTLNINFDFDTNSIEYPDNKYANGFKVKLVTAGSGVEGTSPDDMFPINSSITNHSYAIDSNKNAKILGNSYYELSQICVVAIDNIGISIGPYVCITAPAFVLDLNPPEISVSAVNDGYSVTVTNVAELAKDSYFETEISEVISDAAEAPTSGWDIRERKSVNPIIVSAPDLGTRWVRARFLADSGIYTTYSTAYKVTPITSQGVDTLPPNEVTINSVAWVGEDIQINYSLPATEEPYQFQIALTAPNTQVGYFYDLPALHNTTNPQVLTITKDKIFAQFSGYFSSYTGVIKGIDSNGNRSAGVSFNVLARTNPLTGITPTFSVTPTANGYIVTWTNVVGMTYADVYEKATSWGGGNPTDESDRVYAGQSPVTIQSLNYTTRYIKIRFYDDYGNTSNYSAEQTVVPYDPGLLSLIENPVTFETDGSIIAGSYDEVNNTIDYPAVVFNQDGIFAYDENGNATTQLINTALTGQNTFITTQAQIADWVIHPTKIENTISGTADTYTGLSGTGTYAFWAGSPTAGGSNLSKFWVKPDGSVKAQNIQITGGPSGGKVLDVGGLFSVTSAGVMTATSANITGNITALTGTFKGNVEISSVITDGAVGSLYSGTLSAPNINGISTITGDGFILNIEGLSFWNNGSRVTYIANDDDSAAHTPGTLVTKKAEIGTNWIVDSEKIYGASSSGGEVILKAGTTSGSGLYAKVGVTSAGIAAPGSANGTVAIWAGGSVDGSIVGPQDIDLSQENKTPSFYVKYDGSLFARKAKISGTLSGGGLEVTQWGPGYSFTATGNGYWLDENGAFLLGSSNQNTGSYISLVNNNLAISVQSGGSFRLGPPGTFMNGSFEVPNAALTYIPEDNQLRLSPKTASGTNITGIYLDSFVDDQNYGKNDPMVVRSDGWTKNGGGEGEAPSSWTKTTNQIGRIVKGRRLYWGFNKTPEQALSELSVAGIADAEAGDFFFSTAVV